MNWSSFSLKGILHLDVDSKLTKSYDSKIHFSVPNCSYSVAEQSK
jgi:hypothetical protein